MNIGAQFLLKIWMQKGVISWNNPYKTSDETVLFIGHMYTLRTLYIEQTRFSITCVRMTFV
jgi:hypothetical protein